MIRQHYLLFIIGYLVLSAVLHFSSLGKIVGLKALDLFQTGHVPHPDIVILAVDTKSLEAIGRWPWSRAIHAQIVEKLRELNPTLVAFDIVFSNPENDAADEAFKKQLESVSFPAILAAEAVYTKGNRQPQRVILALETLRQVANVSVGLINIPTDRDGLTRFYPEVLSIQDEKYKPISFQIAEKFQVAIDYKNQSLVNLAGPAGTFTTYSVSDLLAGKIGKEQLEHKAIVIGATASDLRDTLLVPLSKPVIAGAEWHANVADNLLLNRSIQLVNNILPWLVSLVLGLLFLILTGRISSKLISGSLLSLVIIFPIISFGFWQYRLAFPYFINSSLAFSLFVLHGLYRWYMAEAEKRKIRQSFQHYFSPQIMKTILEDPLSLMLGGQRREVTILFSDIRSFTTITESLPPEKLTDLLHEYFTEMTEEILATDGVLDKFIGDAVMAFWGAPVDQPDHADRAVKAALGMIQRLHKLQPKWEAEGYPHVDIGVGINSGMVTVGNMGSHKRFDYTVIGDDVNAAARLEGLNKEYKSNIIISESTNKKLSIPVNKKLLGDVLVKGKTKPLKIYQVIP